MEGQTGTRSEGTHQSGHSTACAAAVAEAGTAKAIVAETDQAAGATAMKAKYRSSNSPEWWPYANTLLRQKNGARKYVDFLRRQAAKEDSEAIWALASAYEDGLSSAGRQVLAPNPRRAVRLYKQAAESGHVDAMLSLARCIGSGRGARRDLKTAMQIERRAASLGSSTAAYNLGVSHKQVGDSRGAASWFERATRMGDPSAPLELAKAKLLGVGLRRDVAGALRVLKAVAKSDRTALAEREEASMLIARTHLDGWLVRRSYARARPWLRRAAKMGSSEAGRWLRPE